MVRSLVLSAVAVLVLASPASAQNSCVQPYAPTVPNGTAANKDQMLAAQNEVKTFIRDSDAYQECILRDVRGQREAARRDQKTLDPAIEEAALRRINANQREKERVGAEYNAAVRAHAAAQPASAPAAP
jgi:hypothetical protein